jgi:hypothetical protein
VVIAVVAAVAAFVLLLPSRSGDRSVFHGKAQPIPTQPRSVPMTPARRRQINSLLDAFVPSAVARHGVASSYALATSALRGGETRAQWATGSIPVSPYPARGSRFHGWTLNYAYPDEVNVSLFLRPRAGEQIGPVSFFVDMRRVGGRWRVNAFNPAAQFSSPGQRAGITSEKDFGPGAAAPGGGAQLSRWWILVPVCIVALPFAWLVVMLVRSLVTGRTRRTPASAYDDYFIAMRGNDVGRPVHDPGTGAESEQTLSDAGEAPTDATPGRR